MEAWLWPAVTLVIALGAGSVLYTRRTAPPAAASGAPETELAQRVTALELERPRFIAEMNGLVEECEDILDRAKRKKAAVDGAKAHETPPQSTQPPLPDVGDELDVRRAAKAQVERRLRGGS